MTRWIAVGAMVLCASCTHSSTSLSANGARLLAAEIASARLAAEQGDYARSDAGIKTVEATVASLQSQHLIGSTRAAEVLHAATTVRRALAALTTSTTTAPPATVAPVPPPTPPPHGPGKDHGHGGHGNDGGD
jgi:hypothetical protein